MKQHRSLSLLPHCQHSLSLLFSPLHLQSPAIQTQVSRDLQYLVVQYQGLTWPSERAERDAAAPAVVGTTLEMAGSLGWREETSKGKSYKVSSEVMQLSALWRWGPYHSEAAQLLMFSIPCSTLPTVSVCNSPPPCKPSNTLTMIPPSSSNVARASVHSKHWAFSVISTKYLHMYRE